MAASIVQQAADSAAWATGVLRETFFNPWAPEFYVAAGPIVAYWVVAGFYELLDRSHHPAIVRLRVTRRQPGKGNPVTHTQVFIRVILQQILQTLLGMLSVLIDPGQCPANPPVGLLHSATQFVIGLFIIDAWQYWIHRLSHVSTFLYKHIHSTHHRLLIPYAMGALYNHPAEALLLDTLSAGAAMYGAGMSCQLAAVFFTFSTVKTVCDHSSYRFPLNPLHNLFPNCAAYHDVHHDIRGIKKNFSQPYFIHWDVLCGTFLDPKQFHMTQKEIDADLATHAPQSAVESQHGDDAPPPAAAKGAETPGSAGGSPSTSSTVTAVVAGEGVDVDVGEVQVAQVESVRRRRRGAASVPAATARVTRNSARKS